MPICWNFKFICVLILSLLLLACGGAKKDDPEQFPPNQAAIVSADVNLSKVSIDLNNNNSADIVLTRKFDDDSETILKLVVAWDADKLVLKDDSDNVIELNYDNSELLAGTAAIKFSDPGSDLDIEFEVELIPESSTPEEPAFVEVNASTEKLEIDLNVADRATFDLVSKFDDDSEVIQTFSFVWDDAQNSLHLRDAADTEITINFDAAALSTGIIEVTFIDSASSEQISIDVVIVAVEDNTGSNPQSPTIQKYLLAPQVKTIHAGENFQLNIAILMSDGSTGVVPTDVKCKLEAASIVIVVTPDCLVTGLLEGEAEVTLIGSQSIDDGLIQKAKIKVLPPYITKAEITSSNVSVIEKLTIDLFVTLTYSNGDVVENNFNPVKCSSSSGLISVSDACIVTGNLPGIATVNLEVVGNNTVEIIGTQVEVIPASITRLRVIPDNLGMEVDANRSLRVIAEYNNNTSTDVSSDANCTIGSGVDVISVLPGCQIVGNKLGDASVNVTLNNSEVTGVGATVRVMDPIVVYSGNNRLLNAIDFGGNASQIVTCVVDHDLPIPIIDTACNITAQFPGSYEVFATLKNTDGNTNTSTLPVIVKAAPLGDLGNAGSFPITMNISNPYTIYEVSGASFSDTYKVKLTVLDDSILVPFYITMKVKTNIDGLDLCENGMPKFKFNFDYNYDVACGIKASNDKFYINLQLDPKTDVTVANANITIEPDGNVLTYAGPLRDFTGFPAYINRYDFEPLTLDTPLVDGHVPANVSGNNISRYNLSIDDPLVNSEKYSLTVKFDSLNFDNNSAIVRWYGGAQVGEPESQCLPNIKPGTIDSLVCEFDNVGQTNIFVEIRGNGEFESYIFNHVTAADGEIGYIILLEQIL